IQQYRTAYERKLKSGVCINATKPNTGTSGTAAVITPKLPPPAANAVKERSASDSDTRARAHQRTKAIPVDSTPSAGARPQVTEPPASPGWEPRKKARPRFARPSCLAATTRGCAAGI